MNIHEASGTFFSAYHLEQNRTFRFETGYFCIDWSTYCMGGEL